MDVESSFPYAGIEADLGEITAWAQFCGDIYRVTAICPDNLLPDEYYIFPVDTQILSAAAKAYGITAVQPSGAAVRAPRRYRKRQHGDPL